MQMIVLDPTILAAAAVILLVLLAVTSLWLRARSALLGSAAELAAMRKSLQDLDNRYRPILDLDNAIEDRRRDLNNLTNEVEKVRADYSNKRSIYDALVHEIAALEDRVQLAELGVYEPSFQFDTSAEYVSAITTNKEAQKKMVSSDRAAICSTNWTVNGSQRDGKTMANRAIKLALRAFNNECEVAINKVTWKNYEASLDRIRKSCDAINRLNKSNHVEITEGFLQLRLEELRLTHEERLRKRMEQERLRDERAALREEERAQREIEAEVRRAEKEEAMRREALAKAAAELDATTGAEREKLNSRIAVLESKLVEAQAAKERAMSMAQQTRVGHVYIISNIGSFGEQVFKIGMTRRIDPMERVQELGDASVPFPFDVHAMIFTEDAPGLERSLQQALDKYRVNRVNPRKEFFRVQRDEVKATLAAKFPNVPFIEQPDAQEYFNSLPKLQIEEMAEAQMEERFPVAI